MAPQPTVPDSPVYPTPANSHTAIGPIATILVIGLVLSLPCILVGLPAEQDGPYHVDYQRSFTEQFWSGDLYPRWLMDINAGLGSPIFYLQYPAPYFAAALLSPLIPERTGQPKAAVDLGLVAALALIGSGITAWLWLRTEVKSWAAVAGAVAYMLLPYHVAVDLYSRAAIGEHCAFLWLPLCMLFAGRIGGGSRRAVLWFAVTVALLLTTHLFTGLLFLPIPIAWALMRSWRRQLSRGIPALVAGVLLSFGLAAVYLLPLAEHRQWFDHRLLETDGSDNYNYRNHFGVFTEPFLRYAADLGVRTGVGPRALNFLAACMLVLAVIAAAAARVAHGASFGRAIVAAAVAASALTIICLPASESVWRTAGLIQPIDFEASIFTSKVFVTVLCTAITGAVAAQALALRERGLAALAAVTGLGALFMALPYSKALWDAIPQLALLDFPWRFGTLLTFATAVLVALAMDSLLNLSTGRARVAAALLAVTLFVSAAGAAMILNVPARFISPGYFSHAGGIEVLLRTYARSNPPEWLRTHAEGLGTMGFARVSKGTVAANRTGPRSIDLAVQNPEPAAIVVKQLYYPAWAATSLDGGADLSVKPTDPEGMIEIAAPAGRHRILLSLERSRSEIVGLWVSIGTLALICGLGFGLKRAGSAA